MQPVRAATPGSPPARRGGALSAGAGVRLVTDSTNYLPESLLERHGIMRVPLFVVEDATSVPETEVDPVGFYARLDEADQLPTSSQPSVEDLVAAFTRAGEGGAQVVGVFLSSKMSGTVDAARLAADIVAAQGGPTVTVLDSESNCYQEGFAILAAAEAAEQGATVGDVREAVSKTIARTRFLFSPASLEYLRKGGRIGNAAAMVGSMLRICPILTVENGMTTTVAKVRTHDKALEFIAERLKADAEAHGLRRAVVHSIASQGDALRFADRWVAPLMGEPVEVVEIGPVIGLHVGPAVGVVYETVDPLR